jgi:rhodanese-related sulfurtransferase
LDQFRSEQGQRSLYLLDVRDPTEYAAGHVAGAVSAPGGQLVQATDHYVGTLGARIVLVDDKEVRAVMTASWLRRMGWKDVFVLVEAGSETGWPENPVLGGEPTPELHIDCAELADLLAHESATVIDLSTSRSYRDAHIPGAWFAIRSRLAEGLARFALRGTVVLTSEDGVLARLATPEACALTKLPVRYLAGGNAAWHQAGLALSSDDIKMANEPVDLWLKPYERQGDTKPAMVEYLNWETDLLHRLERDGYFDFLRSG